MLNCKECEKEFTEGDILGECSNCNDLCCEGCEKEHKSKCMDVGYLDHTNESCELCGNYEENMNECEECSQFYCESCWDEHKENHEDNIKFVNYDYEQYIKENVKEKI